MRSGVARGRVATREAWGRISTSTADLHLPPDQRKGHRVGAALQVARRTRSVSRTSRGEAKISRTIRVAPDAVLDGEREPATIGPEGERRWRSSSWKYRLRLWMP